MSTTTENLNLFKYDPIQDAKKTFNIQQALNNNWDKIDNMTPTKANTALSNLTDEGKAKFDGQWVKGGGYIFQNRTLSTSTSPVQFTISFLPDNDIYELLLYSYITNISNSTFDGIIHVNTDIVSGVVVGHIWQNTQGALGCSTIVPVSNKRLYLVGASFNSNARGSLSCIGYRKVGIGFEATTQNEET